MNAYLEARRDAIAAYCRKWKIVEFSLFGSVLREDFGAGSNVDVLVRFRPDVMRRYADAVAMENELADIFGRDVESGRLSFYRRLERESHPAQGDFGIGAGDLLGARWSGRPWQGNDGERFEHGVTGCGTEILHQGHEGPRRE